MGLDPETGRIYLVAAEVDTQATTKAAHGGDCADPDIPSLRMTIVPGSLKLLFFDSGVPPVTSAAAYQRRLQPQGCKFLMATRRE